MKGWVDSKKAAIKFGCSQDKIRYYANKGKIDCKNNPEDKRGKLYKLSHIKKLGIGSRNPFPRKEVKKYDGNKEITRKDVPDHHCKGCTFANKVSKEKISCPFSRCIRYNGWSADQKEYERVR